MLAWASTCPTQKPATKNSGVRLTYELPVDAMQRTLQKQPDTTMENLLTDAVQAVRCRPNPASNRYASRCLTSTRRRTRSSPIGIAAMTTCAESRAAMSVLACTNAMTSPVCTSSPSTLRSTMPT